MARSLPVVRREIEFTAIHNALVEKTGVRGIALVGDPLPYGLNANMPSIEAMLTYGLQQKLIPARMPLDEVFVDPEKI